MDLERESPMGVWATNADCSISTAKYAKDAEECSLLLPPLLITDPLFRLQSKAVHKNATAPFTFYSGSFPILSARKPTQCREAYLGEWRCLPSRAALSASCVSCGTPGSPCEANHRSSSALRRALILAEA